MCCITGIFKKGIQRFFCVFVVIQMTGEAAAAAARFCNRSQRVFFVAKMTSNAQVFQVFVGCCVAQVGQSGQFVRIILFVKHKPVHADHAAQGSHQSGIHSFYYVRVAVSCPASPLRIGKVSRYQYHTIVRIIFVQGERIAAVTGKTTQCFGIVRGREAADISMTGEASFFSSENIGRDKRLFDVISGTCKINF